MKSIDFKGAFAKIGANQQDLYNVIHAYPLAGPEGEMIACYELTDEELEKLIKTKRIYYSRLTFGQPFQPMRIQVDPVEINVNLIFNGETKQVIGLISDQGLTIPGYKIDNNGDVTELKNQSNETEQNNPESLP